MNNIIELSDGSVPNFGSSKAMLSLNLRREVTEHDDRGLIRTKEERANEQVGGSESSGVAVVAGRDQLRVRARYWSGEAY